MKSMEQKMAEDHAREMGALGESLQPFLNQMRHDESYRNVDVYAVREAYEGGRERGNSH